MQLLKSVVIYQLSIDLVIQISNLFHENLEFKCRALDLLFSLVDGGTMGFIFLLLLDIFLNCSVLFPHLAIEMIVIAT